MASFNWDQFKLGDGGFMGPVFAQKWNSLIDHIAGNSITSVVEGRRAELARVPGLGTTLVVPGRRGTPVHRFQVVIGEEEGIGRKVYVAPGHIHAPDCDLDERGGHRPWMPDYGLAPDSSTGNLWDESPPYEIAPEGIDVTVYWGFNQSSQSAKVEIDETMPDDAEGWQYGPIVEILGTDNFKTGIFPVRAPDDRDVPSFIPGEQYIKDDIWIGDAIPDFNPYPSSAPGSSTPPTSKPACVPIAGSTEWLVMHCLEATEVLFSHTAIIRWHDAIRVENEWWKATAVLPLEFAQSIEAGRVASIVPDIPACLGGSVFGREIEVLCQGPRPNQTVVTVHGVRKGFDNATLARVTREEATRINGLWKQYGYRPT